MAALTGRVAVRFADTALVTQAIDGTPCDLVFSWSLGADATCPGRMCSAILVNTLRIEQIVTGLAINLPGSGLTVFWRRAAFADAAQTPAIRLFGALPLPGLAAIPALGPVPFSRNC